VYFDCSTVVHWFFVFSLNISDQLDILSDSDCESENGLQKVHQNETVPVFNSSDNGLFKVENHKMSSCVDKKCDAKTSGKSPLTMSQSSMSSNKRQLKKLSQLPKPSFNILSEYEKQTNDAPPRSTSYYRYIEKPSDDFEDEVCILHFFH